MTSDPTVSPAVVGLRREREVLTVALATHRHVVLEGPPGTGKSTLLRAVAAETGQDVVFVEGNAELTPARLVGQYDPSAVLAGGYLPENFTDGPLLTAMRGSGLLYLEELNRIPEETLNVLITVLTEGEVAERAIVAGVTGAAEEQIVLAVRLVRATREHRDLRTGSSVRGAIDLVLLLDGLLRLRGGYGLSAPGARETARDAAHAALSGRVRVTEGVERTPESVLDEILDEVWPEDMPPPEEEDPAGSEDQAEGGAQGKGEGPPSETAGPETE